MQVSSLVLGNQTTKTTETDDASVSTNGQHGHRRTNDDKRRAVTTLLNDPEWMTWGNREIARRCGVTHPFVESLRDTGNGYQYPKNETIYIHPRTGQPTVMNTANMGRARPLDFGAPEDSCPNCHIGMRPGLSSSSRVPPVIGISLARHFGQRVFPVPFFSSALRVAVLCGQREPRGKLLDALELEAVVVFRRKKPEQ